MNRLDLMPQTSRLADSPQTSRAPSFAADAQQSGKGSDSGLTGFDTLLEGFSREQGRESVELSQDASVLNLGDRTTDIAAADATALQALLSVTPTDGVPMGASTPSPGSHAYSALESLLPRILSKAGGPDNVNPEGRGVPSMLASDATVDSILNPAMGSKLSVSVQNQETHFRPIVEGFEAALEEAPPTGSVDLPTEAVPADTVVKKSREPTAKLSSDSLHERSGDKLFAQDVEATSNRQRDEERSLDKTSLGRMADRAEVHKQAAPGFQKAEGGSLPAGTLHQMARAILDDVSAASESLQPALQGDGMHRVAIARASGGVLRVLSLQLNPVELGLVTIKMRLAGDSLEMELQVEKQETAELLRNDAEKLSSLLRNSGYRPDVITIQSVDSTSHDRNSFQRPHQGAQDQSFQGNADGQGNSSGQPHGSYRQEEAEISNEPKQGRTSDRSHSGGVYL